MKTLNKQNYFYIMIRCVLFFLVISLTAFGQQRIDGKVIDRETGKPIPFASIGIVGLPSGTSSNINGEFSLIVPDTFALKATCVGYESMTVYTASDSRLIALKSVATQLDEIVVLARKSNPEKIVRKAFASIGDNYGDQSFIQRFFYRQYNKTDDTYERLIEASVDLWKQNGYRTLRTAAGENETMRINQLRRSLDITGMVQGQTPISLDYVLQADIVAYQKSQPEKHLKAYEEVSSLKTDFNHFSFSFEGVTSYDGQHVYKIHYESMKDSVLTTSGYVAAPSVTGSLYITTDTYAFVKTEETRQDGINTFKASAYYLKHKGKYYPYHLVREGESSFKNLRSFHVELIAIEISHEEKNKFTRGDFSRADLLNIPYDSTFWNSATILKTTPLENDIVSNLGGGNSLNKQFYLYKQYELNVTDGGINGEEKFNWLKEDSKDKRILYIGFWNSDFKSYLTDMEYFKRLNLKYKNKVIFVLISSESDELRWKQLVKNYNYFSDGIINYRIGSPSGIMKELNIKAAPGFVLISKDGNISEAKRPGDPQIENDFKNLIEQSKE